MAEKTLLDRLNIAIENASNPKTQVKSKGSYMDYDDTEERVVAKKQMALLDAAKREKARKEAEPSKKFAEEQAAAEADPDVAAMEEAGGMGELDFRDFTEQGLAASRGKEYADEVEGQEEFSRRENPEEYLRREAMEKAASEKFGGAFPDVYAEKPEPMGNVTTVVGSPPPVAEKAKFDGAAILDEADIARRSDVPQDKLAELFKKTHGGSFDPKSKVDKEKMSAITSMIQNDRSLLNLSPTKFALKVYASKK
jgi:hypothetical protein